MIYLFTKFSEFMPEEVAPTGADLEEQKRKKVVTTVVAIVVLVLVGIFAVRVIFLYDKIVSGEIGDEYSYTDKLSTSRAVAAVASAPGEFVDVATDDDPYLGSPEAPITIVEFADFGCPYSAEVSYTVRRIATAYPDFVRIIYRDFPLTDIHPEAQMAAEAGECAHAQGKFWEYHDKLYNNQTELDQISLFWHAAEIGLDTSAFAECLEGSDYRSEVLNDYADGVQAGVYGTPTFFFNGHRVEGAVPYDVFELIILSLASS